jgi:peptidoglycan/xylan/chitin deacetylase (PgdA/CDA1 family)
VRSVFRILDPILGGWALRRQRQRHAGVILLYHRISPFTLPFFPALHPTVFREHLEVVRGAFEVIPLAEFVLRHRQGRSLGGFASITFDDGYRDFLEYAMPELERCDLPCAHFVIGRSLADGLPPWNARRNRIGHLCLPCYGPVPEALDLNQWTYESRCDVLDRFESGFDPGTSLPRMIREADLSQGNERLVEWGSHTMSHTWLGTANPRRVRAELGASKAHLEVGTKRTVRFVSYPQGSVSDDVLTAAAEAGYEAGFTVGQREVLREDSHFSLPRIDVTDMPTAMLRLELATFVERTRALVRRFR